MISISDLINEIGSENISLQLLSKSIVSIKESTDNTTVSFVTDADLDEEALVLWVDKDVFNEAYAMLKARGDMEFKHSPAPWKYTIRNANEIMTTFHGVTIGDVYLDITTANQKADSHLIAAAPELLEALIELTESAKEAIDGLGDLSDAIDTAKAAIAKALGQQ